MNDPNRYDELVASIRHDAYQILCQALVDTELAWYADDEEDGPTWEGQEVANAINQVLQEAATARHLPVQPLYQDEGYA